MVKNLVGGQARISSATRANPARLLLRLRAAFLGSHVPSILCGRLAKLAESLAIRGIFSFFLADLFEMGHLKFHFFEVQFGAALVGHIGQFAALKFAAHDGRDQLLGNGWRLRWGGLGEAVEEPIEYPHGGISRAAPNRN